MPDVFQLYSCILYHYVCFYVYWYLYFIICIYIYTLYIPEIWYSECYRRIKKNINIYYICMNGDNMYIYIYIIMYRYINIYIPSQSLRLDSWYFIETSTFTSTFQSLGVLQLHVTTVVSANPNSYNRIDSRILVCQPLWVIFCHVPFIWVNAGISPWTTVQMRDILHTNYFLSNPFHHISLGTKFIL